MNVVAPLSAVMSAVVPVVAGLIEGEQPELSPMSAWRWRAARWSDQPGAV